MPGDLPADTITKKLASAGAFFLGNVQHRLGAIHGFKQVLIVTECVQSTVADLDGAIFAEFARPGPGVKDVGNGRRPRQRYNDAETSAKS